MPTITNHSTLSLGYQRDRTNLSNQLRTIFLGKMNKEQFQTKIQEITDNLQKSVRSICFQNNKAVITCWDGKMYKYSYTTLV